MELWCFDAAICRKRKAASSQPRPAICDLRPATRGLRSAFLSSFGPAAQEKRKSCEKYSVIFHSSFLMVRPAAHVSNR